LLLNPHAMKGPQKCVRSLYRVRAVPNWPEGTHNLEAAAATIPGWLAANPKIQGSILKVGTVHNPPAKIVAVDALC
jgi:hypothetical protein